MVKLGKTKIKRSGVILIVKIDPCGNLYAV